MNIPHANRYSKGNRGERPANSNRVTSTENGANGGAWIVRGVFWAFAAWLIIRFFR